MARVSASICAAFALLLAAAFASPPHTSAEDAISRALRVLPAQSQRIGPYTWLEDCGMGVKLAPAPRGDEWPRLLAGNMPGLDEASAALWELGPDGIAALHAKFAEASFNSPTAHVFRPRAYPADIAANWRTGTIGSASAATLEFAAADRNFAFVFASGSDARAELERTRDNLLREFVMLPDVASGSVAPLLLEGRYACVLPGWTRVGERFYGNVPGGWLGLRIFQVAEDDFDSLDALWNSLESDLTAAGFKQAFGERPAVASTAAFMREYFRTDDGYVQRILYAKLNGGYLVSLMQAPQVLREQLKAQSARFAASITPLELGATATVASPGFAEVRSVRCVAWQEGRSVLWGALFDDARRQPVAWRQKGIRWEIKAMHGDKVVAARTGTADSSRALNPLVDAETRALEIDGDWIGTLELELDAGGARTTTVLRIR